MDEEQFKRVVGYLQAYDKHLESIRNMMQFFVVLVILSLILGACNVIMNFGR